MAEVRVFESRDEMMAAFGDAVADAPPVAARVVRGGITVLPHVQRFTDDAEAATGVDSWGTYPDHHPAADRAVDAWPRTVEAGWRLAEFFIENLAFYGGRYMMWQHQIWHRDDPVWRWVSDRGSPTANHMDHPHLGFEKEAEGGPKEEDDMADHAEQLQRIEDNVKNIGRIFHHLGDGNWEVGADRVARAVEKIEQLGDGDSTGNVNTGGGRFVVTGTLDLSAE